MREGPSRRVAVGTMASPMSNEKGKKGGKGGKKSGGLGKAVLVLLLFVGAGGAGMWLWAPEMLDGQLAQLRRMLGM